MPESHLMRITTEEVIVMSFLLLTSLIFCQISCDTKFFLASWKIYASPSCLGTFARNYLYFLNCLPVTIYSVWSQKEFLGVFTSWHLWLLIVRQMQVAGVSRN